MLQSIALSHSVFNVAQVSHGGLKPGPANSVLTLLVTRLSGGDNFESVTGYGLFVVSLRFFYSVSHSCNVVKINIIPTSLTFLN
jgi:hypothetical protein